MQNNSSSSSGIGLVGILQIVFIILKLLNIITLSWWWVLCPLWIIPGCLLIVGGISVLFKFALILIFCFVTDKIEALFKKGFIKKNNGK